MVLEEKLSKRFYMVVFKDAIVEQIIEYRDSSDLGYGEALLKETNNRPYITLSTYSLEECLDILRKQNIPVRPTIEVDLIREEAIKYGYY
jgi:hypothetical protein